MISGSRRLGTSCSGTRGSGTARSGFEAKSNSLATQVLADATSGGVRPGPITFTTAGGQAVVTIPETVAALEPSFLPAGRFLWSSAPPVDAVVGEEAVLFLNYGTFYGLFDGKYAYQIKLLPANELYYKFAVDGENLKNAALHANATEGPFVLSLDELRKAVEGADLRGADKWHLSPDGGKVHAMPADHEHEPVVEPPDEQGGGPTPAPSDISREPTTP